MVGILAAPSHTSSNCHMGDRQGAAVVQPVLLYMVVYENMKLLHGRNARFKTLPGLMTLHYGYKGFLP